MTTLATAIDLARVVRAHAQARTELLELREEAGHWVGELSSSPLATATAISACALVDRNRAVPPSENTRHSPSVRGVSASPHGSGELRSLIDRGIAWLVSQQNPDGGWGDTPQSYSNIATTMLALAAFDLADGTARHRDLVVRAENYVASQGGIAGVRRRYGVDKTFAVPILTNYALAGRCGWHEVASLPFELACIPQRFYHAVQLPVVSYAIPALVAVGQAGHFHRRSWNPYRWIRHLAVGPSTRVLSRMQPASGGYLEAIPLTSFVVMSLAATGRAGHDVAQQGIRFLRETVRPDGSWPIDTNLSTWNTSLAIHAIGVQDTWQPHRTLHWLLECQHRERHPFTGAEPGGWGWSDLSGAVPDADDTPAALLALAQFRDWPALVPYDAQCIRQAATLGVAWLLQLQNKDGGWPTFCRGWGKLPFDRSGTDLTAHAMRALQAWSALINPRQLTETLQRGFAFLEQNQNSDGSWTPLWFGNQDHPQEENPVYGTSKVLLAYHAFGRAKSAAARRAATWLVQAQQPDGGWGTAGGRVPWSQRETPEIARSAGPQRARISSVEETSLAVEALLGFDADPKLQTTTWSGLNWLVEGVETGYYRAASPIGLYFAKLWYDEKLYPLTFTVSALRAATRASTVSDTVLSGYLRTDSVSTRDRDVRTTNEGKDGPTWIQHQCHPQSPTTPREMKTIPSHDATDADARPI